MQLDHLAYSGNSTNAARNIQGLHYLRCFAFLQSNRAANRFKAPVLWFNGENDVSGYVTLSVHTNNIFKCCLLHFPQFTLRLTR